MLIDLGGNLLPGFVGGSRVIEDCVERINTLYSAGVVAAVLTPRYYPAKMSVEEFVGFRGKVTNKLAAHMPKKSPVIYIGSEVYIDERLKYISSIGELAVKGTRTIIADMPSGVWETALLDTLDAIRATDFEVLITHIDRYPPQYAEALFKLGYKAILDVCAFFGMANYRRRRQFISWIDDGFIVGLGGNFEADEKRAHEKILKIQDAIDNVRCEKLAESSARYLAGAVPFMR